MKLLRILAVATVLASGLTLAPGALASGASVLAPNCASAQLRVSLGTPQGAAGTIYVPVVITNTGRACQIWGVPAIQPVVVTKARRFAPVGPRARNTSIGQMPVRHVVAKAKSFSDAFGVTETGNYTPSTCRARNATGVVVSLGGFLTRVYVPLKISVCTRLASTTTRLIVAGTAGD
ncbi:MAG: DUF4232 domain-containing protein [Acidobacteria bacterium]|nr:DUF4232 domain-containing protein [Acidobacteriota bacterium]